MRVLFVNSREDAQQNPGGDSIQMRKTKAGLENLGVTVEVRNPQELDDLPAFDMAHVFNVQEPESSWSVYQALSTRGKPFALSPIYWDMVAHWFELAVEERARWRKLVRILGKARTRLLYLSWQRWKAPANTRWRTQRRLLNHAARVLPNSQSEADLLQKTFMLRSSIHQKIDVIPNGIDPGLYLDLPSPSQSFAEVHGVKDFVLEVGTIHPAKNQLGLVEALYDLPVPIVFIGQTNTAMTDYAKALRIRAAARGNVIFIERVPHEELPGVYALAAVHVLPSWRETPGLVSLEAAVAGCRVVTTSIGSARDYFGDLAWYCYPNDLQSIRQAVEIALQSPPPRGLRHRILSNYTWQHAAKATLASYKRALNGE